MQFADLKLRCRLGWHKWGNIKFAWKMEMVTVALEARYCEHCEKIHPDDLPTIKHNTMVTGILPGYSPRRM